MNILITGAAGFIGSQLAHYLYKNNNIVLLDNMSYGKEDNLKFDDVDLNKNLIIDDIRNTDKINQILKENNIDTIFHIAGIAPLPDCQSNPVEALSVNVGGTVNIFECARRNGIKRIVFASTNALYENLTLFPTGEDDLTSKTLPTLIYPNTKYCAERFAQSYCDTYGMSIGCVRFANVYGPHIDCLRKQPPFVAYMIRELFFDRVPEFFSDGTQARDYVYVEDLIELLLKVAEQNEGFDIVNCCSMKSYSVKDLFNITRKIMHKENIEAHYNSSIEYWKKYPELYQGVFPISPSILEHEVNKFSLCNNTHAWRKYGWEPKVDIHEGLEKMISYTCLKLSK